MASSTPSAVPARAQLSHNISALESSIRALRVPVGPFGTKHLEGSDEATRQLCQSAATAAILGAQVEQAVQPLCERAALLLLERSKETMGLVATPRILKEAISDLERALALHPRCVPVLFELSAVLGALSAVEPLTLAAHSPRFLERLARQIDDENRAVVTRATSPEAA